MIQTVPFWLDYCNTLWASGHYYTSVLLYLPVQIAIVFLHPENIKLYIAVMFGYNFNRR
jgi:hypothetical protein